MTATKPRILRVVPENIPDELKTCSRWLVWEADERPDGGMDKVPHNYITGYPTSVTAPASWSPFDVILADYLVNARWSGIGFALHESDDIFAFDIDKCRDPETGAVTAEAGVVVKRLNTYTEVSPSGTGLRLFGKGKLSGKGRKNGSYEVYDRGRFVTVTGHHLDDTPATLHDCQAALDQLVLELFGSESHCADETTHDGYRAKRVPTERLLAEARKAKNGEKFSRLWGGDISDHGYDDSRADAALCRLLAFWTGPDTGWIEDLIRESRLYREKWERADYRDRTIGLALQGLRDWYEWDPPHLNNKQADGGAEEKAQKKSQADLLVALAGDADLFHDPDGEGYATIPIADHKETWLLKSRGFRRWLARCFHEKHDKAPGAQAMQDALCVLEGQALFTGPEHPVYTRLAGHEGKIYLDLANEQWQVVEISIDGWRVVNESPVKFRRTKGMLPILTPIPGGRVDDLRPFVNLATDADWYLYVAWLLAGFRPAGPYPILCAHGEQGSAKTTLSRVARRLIDPNGAPLRSEPREVRDIMIAATNGWIVGYDNLSRLPDWLSDSLCRLSTGGGFSTRELYSDADEILFEAQRPVALNGIEELATRADLLDRAIILYLAAIPEEKRRPESLFWTEFEAKQPGILGALLSVVSQALKRLPDTKLGKLPRMADFALWGTAAETALGWERAAFMKAYTQNRRDANDLSLEASPVAEAILAFMSSRERWTGTSSVLLAELNQQADEEKRKSNERLRLWPTSARLLSNTLRRLAPNLKVAGIEVTFVRTGRARTIQLEKRGNSLSPSSSASPQDENPRPDAENHGDDETPFGDDESAQRHSASPPSNSSSPKHSAYTRGKSGEGDADDDGDDEIRTHSKSRSDPNFCQVCRRLLPNAAARAAGMHPECAAEVDDLLFTASGGAR